MGCLDIVWVIVSPGSAHAFRFLVVGNDVVVISELLVADSAYPTLLEDLAVHQFAHFGG